VGAESLRGRGDFIVVNGSQLRHFQVAYVSDPLLQAWERRFPPRPPAVPVAGVAEVERKQAPRAAPASTPVGRPRDEIPAEVLALIAAYMEDRGRAPSCNWVYSQTRLLVPGGGYSRAKARRAIAMAAAKRESGGIVQGVSNGQADS